jgi:hypothetical protein
MNVLPFQQTKPVVGVLDKMSVVTLMDVRRTIPGLN